MKAKNYFLGSHHEAHFRHLKGYKTLTRYVLLVFITITFLIAHYGLMAQTSNLYFEKNGSFRYRENLPSKKGMISNIKFTIENDSNAVFLIAVSEAVNYSLPGIGVKPKILLIDDRLINSESGKKSKKSKKKGKEEGGIVDTDVSWDLSVKKHSKHLFYRIYRFPKELLYDDIKENISYNQLLFELNRKASVIVRKKRAALKNQLDALTFTEFIQLNKRYSTYKQSISRLEQTKHDLRVFLNSDDSLSIEDKVLYNAMLAERNLYLKEVKRNEEFISTDNALEYLKTVRQKYLTTLSEVVKFEAKKLTYRTEKERALRKKITHLYNNIISLKEDMLLRNFLTAEEFLNKTYDYSLDILYEGHITLENSAKEVEYNHHYNLSVSQSQLERQTPVLPHLTNRNYLSVVVHNVPGTLMTQEGNIPFQLSLAQDSIEQKKTKYDISRLREFDTQNIYEHKNDLIKLSYSEIEQCKGFEEQVENMKISEIVTSSLIDEGNSTAKDSCLMKFEKKLVSTVGARDVLYESIQSFGGDQLSNSSRPIFRDYTMTSGRRFRAGDIPAVIINTSLRQINDNKSITMSKVALIKDSLESVQKLQRFGISTGLVMKSMPYYTQRTENIPGTNFNKLIEKKFTDASVQPVIFFSVYLKEQNLNKPSKRAGSINLGIDYADGDLLDNFYFGYGIEPIRHFQIVIGATIGRVDKVDMDSFDQLSNTFETKNEMAIGTFISANFYLSAIPKIIPSIFKK